MRLFCFFVLFGQSLFALSGPERTYGPLKMSLVSEYNGFVDDDVFWVAWRISREAGWHTYWEFPGDVGVPPSVKWDLPPGIIAEKMIFPPPERIMMFQVGAYGHTGESIFLFKFRSQVPFREGESISIKGKFSWLTCSNTCVPGYGELSIDIPAMEKPARDPLWHPRFEIFRKSQPSSPPENWKFEAEDKGNFAILKIPSLKTEDAGGLFFYPESRMFRSNKPQPVRKKNGVWEILLTKSEWDDYQENRLRGLVYRRNGWNGNKHQKFLRISVPLS